MRTPSSRVVLSAAFRSVRLASSPSRTIHATAPSHFPRRRSFFTSNPYLSLSSDEGDSSSSKHQASRDDHPQRQRHELGQPQASATKRKPSRTGPAKGSLRRVAIIAQRPARTSNATAFTEGKAHQAVGQDSSAMVSATCLAESFNMVKVEEILSAQGFTIDPDGTGFDANEVIHARDAGASTSGGGDGHSSGTKGHADLFVFPSGTVVTWSLPPDVVSRQILHAAEDAHPVEQREVEDLEFTSDTARESSVLKGDVIVLGTRREHRDGDTLDTTLAKIAFSSGLARSTKLAVLESALTAYFSSTRNIPALLSQGAGVPLGRSFILQKTGELLSLRARLNHYSELTDSLPDIFWDSRSELGLEGYYDQVGRALDVGVRIRALNQKMDYAQEIATVLREMSSEQHGTRLELIIILLIAVEVVFEVRRILIEWNQDSEKKLASTS